MSRKYIGFLLTMIAWFVVTCAHLEGIFYVLSSMALSESVIFALIGVVRKAILVITDPQDHFFRQSLFKFKNRGVGIFILQSGVSESPFHSFGNYGSTLSLISSGIKSDFLCERSKGSPSSAQTTIKTNCSVLVFVPFFAEECLWWVIRKLMETKMGMIYILHLLL